MMLKDDKRRAATIIVRKMKDGSEAMRNRPESAGAEMAESEDLYMLADDVMEAFKQGDTRHLKESMEAFVECCMGKNSQKSSGHDDSEY